MPFPSTLSTFPRPNSTDRLNSPSHSALHNTVSSALGQVEAVIGVEGSPSVVGTLQSLIKSPASNGGGHVQTAPVGGTGQTVFIKSDILVASSPSTLSRLAVGTDGQILSVSSTNSVGIAWVNNSTVKLSTNASMIGIAGTEVSVLSYSMPGSTLGTNNATRTTAFFTLWDSNPGSSIVAAVQYGGLRVASVLLTQNAGAAAYIGAGHITHTMIASSLGIQRHFLEFDASMQGGTNPDKISYPQPSALSTVVKAVAMTTSAVDSGATQTLGMTVIAPLGPGGGNGLRLSGVVVEKIS